MTPFTLYHRHWSAKRDRLCATDPTWAEIEARRHHADGRTSTIFLSDEHRLGWDEWDTQEEIAERLCPHTWVHRVHWWLQAHGPRVQWRNLRDYHQRGRRGWADSDTWGLDTYLARVISTSTAHLRDNAHGYPGTDECPTEDRWYQILTEISQRFGRYEDSKFPELADIEHLDWDARHAAYLAAGDEWGQNKDFAFALLGKWIGHLWD